MQIWCSLQEADQSGFARNSCPDINLCLWGAVCKGELGWLQVQSLNGTRQGSMASPALWSVYLDLLIKELRQLGVGCYVGGIFMGVVVYADDILLMAPTRGSMQMMLDKWQTYAAEHNIMFSTDPNPSKSKMCPCNNFLTSAMSSLKTTLVSCTKAF